jgi:hypothetical protein
VFVERVDMVCGVGYDRIAAAGPGAARFHRLPRVVTDLAVLDFATPDHSMRLVSVHPGVSVEQVAEATGFALTVPDEVPFTRDPTPEELELIRTVIDTGGLREREVPDPRGGPGGSPVGAGGASATGATGAAFATGAAGADGGARGGGTPAGPGGGGR